MAKIHRCYNKTGLSHRHSETPAGQDRAAPRPCLCRNCIIDAHRTNNYGLTLKEVTCLVTDLDEYLCSDGEVMFVLSAITVQVL